MPKKVIQKPPYFGTSVGRVTFVVIVRRCTSPLEETDVVISPSAVSASQIHSPESEHTRP